MSQQPTFHITKEHFVGVINSLHEQFVKDKQCSESFSQIFHAEAGFYDNSALINAVFSFLHEVFPKDEDGNCEINHYCYYLDFGKNGEEYESPEELYDRLNVYETLKDGTVIKKKFKAWGDFTELGVKLDLELWEARKNQVVEKFCFMACDALTVGAGRCGCKNRVNPYVAPEDSFLSNGLDQLILCKNQEKTDGGKPNPYLIDEAGQFPSDAMEMQKKYWQHVVSEGAKPSPDETA